MISRRGFLTGGAASLTGAWTLPAELVFEVMRNGSPIGRHAIGFRQDGDTIAANITVEIAAGLGPIVLYRYKHTARETWRDGRFQSLESETNDDGTHYRVTATRTADNVAVDVAGAARTLFAAETIPLTHWNSLCMERPLFNPQDGVPITSRIVTHGQEMVPLANGGAVRATHYSLVGKVALDDWYDTVRLWIALRSVGRDGSNIEYRRLG
jgi:hypothetical protein